jgi:DNA polymerase-3 subunit beta
MIRRTIFAAASEHARYAMNGVLWELEGETARLVATDGRRLALASGSAVPHGGHDTKGQTHVVPSKAMQLLERNLQDADERVKVCLQPNEALFKTERAMIYSRLVEGRYPPYRDVFPKKQTAKVPLVAGPFHAAVRQAAIMTDEESKKVVFSFAKKKLTMQARGPATGRSKVELPLEYDGKELSISFDPKFLTEMLRVLDPDRGRLAVFTTPPEAKGTPAAPYPLATRGRFYDDDELRRLAEEGGFPQASVTRTDIGAQLLVARRRIDG